MWGCFVLLPAELAAEDPPIRSADPCDDPPDDPTDEFTIRLVTPATIDPTMFPIKPKKSEPPFCYVIKHIWTGIILRLYLSAYWFRSCFGILGSSFARCHFRAGKHILNEQLWLKWQIIILGVLYVICILNHN